MKQLHVYKNETVLHKLCSSFNWKLQAVIIIIIIDFAGINK